MPITVIPADDQSGANVGYQILADAFARRSAARRQQQASYQDLIIKLSDPNTTEEQQNAVLSQDPKQFQSQFGVPLAQVGKDVTRFRAALTPGAGPDVAPGGAQGMQAASKRVLVEHPGGTAQEQQQRAQLASTEATTAADNQRTEYYKQGLGLNAREGVLKDAEAIVKIKQSMRTVDGKVPSTGQAQDFIRGTFDLYPTSEVGKRLEGIREILGGDPEDPAMAYAQLDLALDSDVKDATLDHLREQTKKLVADQAMQRERLTLIQKGIDPDTGKSLTGADKVDPKDIIASGKAFNDALTKSLGPIGYPSQTESKKPWSVASVMAGRYTISKDPKLAAVLFGTGVTEPAAVRADLLAAFPAGEKPRFIKVPTIDAKGMLVEKDLTIDQAVPAIVQVRRQLATNMPPVFAALRQTSAQTLFEIATGDPLVEQMARIYAPDIAQNIAIAREARKSTLAATQTPGAGAPAVNPNIAPILELRDMYQKEIDDMKAWLQGTGANPASPSNRPR